MGKTVKTPKKAKKNISSNPWGITKGRLAKIKGEPVKIHWEDWKFGGAPE